MWARIDNNKVTEIIDFNPINKYHPDILWVACDENVKEGYIYDGEFKSPEYAKSIDQLKSDLYAQVNKIKDKKSQVNVVYNGNPYDANNKSIQNIMGAITLAADDEQIIWTDANNQPQTLVKADLVEIARLIKANVNNAYIWARVEDSKIDVLITQDELINHEVTE